MHVKNILKLIKCTIGLFYCYYYAYYRFRVFYCCEWILKLLLSQWNLSVLFQVKFCMRKLNFVRILAEHDENGRSSMLCSVVQHRPPPGIFTTLHTCMHTHKIHTHTALDQHTQELPDLVCTLIIQLDKQHNLLIDGWMEDGWFTNNIIIHTVAPKSIWTTKPIQINSFYSKIFYWCCAGCQLQLQPLWSSAHAF